MKLFLRSRRLSIPLLGSFLLLIGAVFLLFAPSLSSFGGGLFAQKKTAHAAASTITSTPLNRYYTSGVATAALNRYSRVLPATEKFYDFASIQGIRYVHYTEDYYVFTAQAPGTIVIYVNTVH